MPVFKCSNCSYSANKETAPERCPYCGKQGTFTRQSTAQDYLDMSD